MITLASPSGALRHLPAPESDPYRVHPHTPPTVMCGSAGYWIVLYRGVGLPEWHERPMCDGCVELWDQYLEATSESIYALVVEDAKRAGAKR